MLAPFKKGLPSPFSLVKKRRYLGTHLKEELINLFQKLPGYSLLLQAEEKEDVKTLRMVKINPICKTEFVSSEDKSMLFTHFCLMEGKIIEIWFASPAKIKPTSFLSAN